MDIKALCIIHARAKARVKDFFCGRQEFHDLSFGRLGRPGFSFWMSTTTEFSDDLFLVIHQFFTYNRRFYSCFPIILPIFLKKMTRCEVQGSQFGRHKIFSKNL